MNDTSNNSGNTGSGESKKPNANRNRNRNRNRNKNRTNNPNKVEGNSNNTVRASADSDKNRQSKNKNRRPKALTPSRILQKYDNLMDQYLTARKKFFDLFGWANQKQVDKVKRNYQTSLNSLRSFETGLNDWQKEVLAKKIDGQPCDRQYTTDHGIEPVGDEVSFVGTFEDPHLLPAQKAEDWAADTEESQGSINDYYSYQGIEPPIKVEKEEVKRVEKKVIENKTIENK